MTEDFTLPSEEEGTPLEGIYIWAVAVESIEMRDREREKPYILLGCKVIEDEYAGFAFDYRLYIHKKSRNWALYFLRKFDYSAELLNPEPPNQPVIRPSAIIGLTGKMLVEVSYQEWGIKVDGKKFDHYGGTEIEEWLAKQEAATEQTVDVESDKSSEPEPDLSWLENL